MEYFLTRLYFLKRVSNSKVIDNKKSRCLNILTWIFNGSFYTVLEKAMATHSHTLAWKIPWMEKPGRLQSMGSLRVGHYWATSLSLSIHFGVLFIPRYFSPHWPSKNILKKKKRKRENLYSLLKIVCMWVCPVTPVMSDSLQTPWTIVC